MALFGSSAESSKLIQFKAGRMTLRNTTVQPDKRKGLLYMEYSPERILVMKWSDRASGEVELDLKLFPGEAEFQRVPQCTTGRVYILRFKDSSRKYFFWMQESNEKGDEALVTKMNNLLTTTPPAPASSGMGGGGGLGGLGGLGLSGERMQNVLANMDPQQLTQLLTMGSGSGASQLADLLGRVSAGGRSATSSSMSSQSAAGSATPPVRRPPATNSASGATSESSSTTGQSNSNGTNTTASTTAGSTGSRTTSSTQPSTSSSSRGVRLEDLASFFDGSPASAAAAGATAGASSVDLSDVITRERLMKVIGVPEVFDALTPLLPEDGSEPSVDTLKSVVTSPQFASALKVFGAGLESGQLAPFMTEFAVSEGAIAKAAVGDVEGFLRALQDSESSSGSKEEGMDTN
ncbi:proteasomal ubiquitin receptor ADRM1-like [Sycon ciliatum]|uniref:proteasomal ubiquitin receptor ADRM1-like n=1 Tax=Sycon ciliatum TaxID=27933 RepID=UPI0020AC20C2|eukprot:scpid73035/ scgid33797/ Proteasomal ubiquitin receptor ADRM1; Adhesion-regulating molecule 1